MIYKFSPDSENTTTAGTFSSGGIVNEVRWKRIGNLHSKNSQNMSATLVPGLLSAEALVVIVSLVWVVLTIFAWLFIIRTGRRAGLESEECKEWLEHAEHSYGAAARGQRKELVSTDNKH